MKKPIYMLMILLACSCATPTVSTPNSSLEQSKISESGQNLKPSSETDKIYTQSIFENANALNQKNLADYAKSFHADSDFNQQLSELFKLLSMVNTRYIILETRLIEENENKVSVEVKRNTVNLDGSIEQDYLYTLKKSGNDWKIFDIAVIDQILPKPQASSEAKETPHESQVSDTTLIELIHDNAEGLNTKNAKQFADTFHPDSPFQASMPELFNSLFQFNTSYENKQVEVTSKSEKSAEVTVARITKDNSGSITQTLIYTIKPTNDGLWKIYSVTDKG